MIRFLILVKFSIGSQVGVVACAHLTKYCKGLFFLGCLLSIIFCTTYPMVLSGRIIGIPVSLFLLIVGW